MMLQMDFRIVFFELLLLFLKDKCNYVELNMSLTFFFVCFLFYAHPPTGHRLLAFTQNPQKCRVCLSKKKVTWVGSKK